MPAPSEDAAGDAHAPVPPPPPAEPGGRLHPSAVAVWSLPQLGALAVVAVLNPVSVVVVAPLAVALVAASAIRYARFAWRLSGEALVVEQGLLHRRRRVIPLERVQSVDLVRGLTHRLFGVVAVRLEAIGGEGTEGRLDALAPEVADALRERLLGRRERPRRLDDTAGGRHADPSEEPAFPTGEVLARLRWQQLVLSGLTEANATLLVAVVGGAWQLLGDRIEAVLERLPGLLGTNLLLGVVVVAVVVALALLVAAQLYLYWGFELRRDGDELQVRRGLLEQRFDTIPLRRLQALRVEENIPRRLLGFAAVRADVAGKPGGGSRGTDTLLPFGTASQARALVDLILDAPGAGGCALHPMPLRARTRRRLRAGLAVAALTVASVAVWDVAGLGALAVAVPALAAADASYRALGWARLPGLLVVRSGWWLRRTAFVPEDRLQSLAAKATWLQRRRALATLELHIARSPGLWAGPRALDLDHGQVGDLTRALARVMAAAGESRPAPVVGEGFEPS